MDASEAFENVRLLLNRRGADNKFVHLNINPQGCMEPELQDFTVHLIQIIVFACSVSDKWYSAARKVSQEKLQV